MLPPPSKQSLPIPPPMTPAERIFMLLVSIFITALITTNLIAGKLIILFGWTLPVSVFVYPFTFILVDIIAELYSSKQAKLMILSGFIVSILTTSLVWIAHRLPVDPNSPIDQVAFTQTLGFLPGIVISSLVAYLLAQFIDLLIFIYLSRLFNRQYLWLRTSIAKLISQLLDSLVVITIAWVIWPKLIPNQPIQPISLEIWKSMLVGQYFFKAIFALLETPLVYIGIHLIRPYLKTNSF